MTRDDLRAAGELLYGPRWQTALARDLNVADRTVRRWAAGKIQIGEGAAKCINHLLALDGHRPLGEPSLAHVTLNTGNIVHSPRSGVWPETMALLAPMIADGRGSPGGVPFLVAERSEAAALVMLCDPPAVACGVCWSEERSTAAWQALIQLGAASGLRRVPDHIPAVPWLGVVVLPTALLLDPATLMSLGDLERCLAWALIEADPSLGGR